jgi:hypothetical protein
MSNITHYLNKNRAGSGTFDWGTALQPGRLRVPFPMVSLKIFIDIIFPAALWLWGPLSLRSWVSLDFKGGRRIRLTTLPPSCTDCLEIFGASTSWTPKGLSRDNFTFSFYLEADTERVEYNYQRLIKLPFFTELTFGNVLQSHNVRSWVSVFMWTNKQTNKQNMNY